MLVRVRLFAMQRQQLGWRERIVEFTDGSTVGDAWRALVAAYPDLGVAGDSIRFARNGAYVGLEEPVVDGDELALIPPVAGGSAEPYRRIELWPGPFPESLVAELRRAVSSPADGAVVLFLGQTRESAGTPAPGQEAAAAHLGAQPVESLDYEAFDAMALAMLDTIADEIGDRFGVSRLAILHRTGEVPLGSASVLIAVAAEHRGSAFDACRYAIDELKARAPIWKQERFADGQVWIGEPPRAAPGAS